MSQAVIYYVCLPRLSQIRGVATHASHHVWPNIILETRQGFLSQTLKQMTSAQWRSQDFLQEGPRFLYAGGTLYQKLKTHQIITLILGRVQIHQ